MINSKNRKLSALRQQVEVLIRSQAANLDGPLLEAIQTILQELQTHQDELRIRHSVLESSINAIALADLEGKLTYVNPSFLRMWGYDSAEEVLGRLSTKFWQSETEALDTMETLRKHGVSFGELVAKRRDGSLFDVELSASVVKDETGNPICMMASFVDITERKQAEKALQASHAELNRRIEERTKELKKANEVLKQEVAERRRTEQELQQAKEAAEVASRAKSEFLTSMSHELRTPLNSILGYAQILKGARSLPSSHLKEVSIIQQSGQHLLTLIDDILDMSKIEAGQMALYVTGFHLPTFLQSLVDIFRVRADQKEILFSYKPGDSLPDGVRADEKRLRQIIINLLSNAIKFTDQGEVIFSVQSLGSRLQESTRSPTPLGTSSTLPYLFTTHRIRLQVKDTGSGIPEEKLAEIFEPFRQVRHQTHFVEGTGLGLAISQHLAQMMDSTLHVKSKVGKGSTFWFDVDLPESTEWPKIFSAPEKTIAGYKGQTRKILIVDDKAKNRSFLRDALSPLGFAVTEAVDGIDGLEKAYQIQPDLILVDLRMPNMDGFELTQKIRLADNLSQAVVIAVSASTSQDVQQKSLAAGCDDFIPKPIQLPYLLEQIGLYLNMEWILEDERKWTNGDLYQQFKIVPPQPEELSHLHRLAMSGDIRGITERLKIIEKMDEQAQPFVAVLQQLAESYQINKIREFITHFEEK